MKKLSLLALLFALSACKSDKLEGEAIKATVVLDPAVKASCIHVEVRDPVTHVAAAEDWVPRGTKNELQVAIFRKSLPKDVEIAAQPFQDGDCANETVARTVNGAFVTVLASFVEGQVVPANLPKMLPGTDTDNDGYVSTDTGGADCQDGAGGESVNPGVQEACTDQQDLNCDSKPGCSASACGSNACIGAPASLALTLPTPVTAGTCTQATVQVKDSSGRDTRAVTNTPVTLTSNPNGGITFYTDSGCQTPAQNSSVAIAQGEGSAAFFFQGQTVGVVTVSASSSGLPTASQSVTINPGTGNQLVFMSAPQTVTAGSCSAAVQLRSQDAQGNPKPVTAATPITLTATPNTNFQFFSSSGCTAGTELASVTMAASSSTATFYFKGTKAGGVSIVVSANGFTGNTQAETIRPAAARTIILTGPSTATAGDCTLTKVDVTLQDTYANPVTATANTTINLSATGRPLTFSASSGCGTSTSSVVIGTGQDTVSFFFRGTQSGTSTITGASGSLTSGTLGVTMNSAAPTAHEFTTTAQTVTAGSCSSVVTVQMRDSFNNPANVSSDTTVSLSASPPDGFQFFAGTGCSGSAVTQVTVPTGANSVNFSFRPTRTPAVTVTASVSTSNKTQSETINPGPPAALVLTPSSVPMLAGECKQVTVQSQDSFGNPTAVSGNQAVLFSANPTTNFGFFSNNGCTTALPSNTINIPNGQSNATLYVKGTTTGTVAVTASHTPWTDGTTTVTVSPAAPSKIVFTTAAQRVVMGSCSGTTTLQVQDTHNNPVSIGANRTINLTPASVTFYTSAGCAGASTTSVVVPSGQTTVDFFFKANSAGSVTLTASDGTLTNGTQAQTIDPLPPDALAFTSPERSAVAGVCSGAVTVETRAQGSATPVATDTTVTPSATGLTFYSNNSCGTVATSVTIPTGQSNVTFYFKGTTAGTVSLTATAGSLSTSQNATITPAAPNKLVFTTPVYSTVAGACSSILTVQSTDTYGNPVAVTGNNSLTPEKTGSPVDDAFKFYSDSACANEITSTFPLNTGQMTASFYYRGQIARSVTIAVAANNLPNASNLQTHTVVPASLSKLVFSSTTPAQTLLAGTCAMRTIVRSDTYGNPVTDPSALTVNLSGSTLTEFFTDSACNTAPVNSVAIPAASSFASFYFKGYTGGTNTGAPDILTASASGLTSGTQTETINPTVRTGTCNLGNTSATCAIAPPIGDMSKTFLVFRAISDNSTSAQANVRCRLNTTSEIVCDRANGGGSNVSVSWSLAEFPTNVTVQHLAPPCPDDTGTVAITNAPVAESFLLLSSLRDVTNQGSSVPRLAELTSATQASLRKTTGGCGPSDLNALQAVRFVGSSVQRGVATMASGATSATASLNPSVVTGRSILLYSYRIADTAAKICDRAIRGELTNGTTVTFSRGEGDTTNCAGMAIPEISWEVVQFPPGTVVQQFTQQISGGLPITISQVDQSRTMVFAGGQWASGQLTGEGRYSAGELISEMRAQTSFIDNSTLQISRGTSNSTATFTVYIVQFKP